MLRKAHGAGASALLRSETRPLDEIPPANAADTAVGLAVIEARGLPGQVGNRAAVGRKPSLALLGIPIGTADPRYRSVLRKAAAYRARRVKELSIESGGYLGAAPAAMLASAALALAASRLMYELGAETLERELFVLGAALADKHRQQELTATDLARHDAKARAEMRGPRDPLAGYVDAPEVKS